MKVRVPGARDSIDKMKYEIANEFGVNLGANASSRENGLVGGEMTKRLIENGMTKSKSSANSNNNKKQTNKRSKKKSK
ncbi:MAG: alpha/beta-type small acid-soluble spore protein [Bacilli bacterium]|nr:alpha/beta-type small acid-soluble spore protein [Bacilli bacterium]